MSNMGLKQLNNVVDLTNKFHHVFFFGDLNYRIANTDTNVRLRGVCAHKMILNIARIYMYMYTIYRTKATMLDFCYGRKF